LNSTDLLAYELAQLVVSVIICGGDSAQTKEQRPERSRKRCLRPNSHVGYLLLFRFDRDCTG
jgi:hypothetical protein